ncbi:MAG: DASH family cryptochrome [Synechococcales cyanobacterium RM1_1_8]|nr:DASH family cryptochrome [Synechococcales cyanobacterium RM1_1_8]
MPVRQLLWFRNDLRLQDHGLLAEAIRRGWEIIPCYCFDPRQFGTTAFGFPKTGSYRAQFLLESLADLRRSLQALGSDLVIRQGYPEVILPELIQQLKADSFAYHREVTTEETSVEARLKAALQPLGTDVQTAWGATLFHPEDLPFGLGEIPEVFTQFRKAIEKQVTVRDCFPTPRQLPTLPADLDLGILPTLSDLGLEPPPFDARAVLEFKGGARAGQQRLQDYFWIGDRLQTYKLTRNGMKGADYSSKFSPWLALGCLSPREIYWQVKDYEQQRIANDSTAWLVFELLWRDYFRLICAKHGSRVFQIEGLRGLALPWKQDAARFERWSQGMTGFPLVDANLRELQHTGFMSNRGRQNVASFLTKNLGIDWRMGAEWFESLLIDYDPCSNWGNWNYTAGVGNDARGFRFFNIQKQAKDYDPEGSYVKHWLPELQAIPAHKVHQPWSLLPIEQQRFGVQLGLDYPQPIVDLFQSAQANEAAYNAAYDAAFPGAGGAAAQSTAPGGRRNRRRPRRS